MPLPQINNRINYVEFPVVDIARAKQFYGDAFGWQFTDFGPEYCEFSDGQMSGGFYSGEPVVDGGAMVILSHDDLTAAESTVVAAGGTISKAEFSFPGGSRFEFCDSEGNRLAVWCAV